MKKFLSLVKLSFTLIFLAFSSQAYAQVSKIYWTEGGGVVKKANPDGSGEITLATGFTRLREAEFDSLNQTLYVSDWGGSTPGKIVRMDLDGNNHFDVVNQGRYAYKGISLDPDNNRVYFARGVSFDGHEVSRINMDGSSYTQLTTSGWFPSGIEVDATNNVLYWGDSGIITGTLQSDGTVTGNLNSFDLSLPSGSASAVIIPRDFSSGRGRAIARDANQNIIFITEVQPHSLRETNTSLVPSGIWKLDGSTLTKIITNMGGADIEVDPDAQRIYWTDDNQGAIRSADYDGNDIRDEITGLFKPLGLALDLVPETDGDGIPDNVDNCPFVPNPSQLDTDLDGLGEECDNCPYDADNDIDGDGICGDVDNCPADANSSQLDNDGDLQGDACDVDDDNDNIPDTSDNCPLDANSNQDDLDGDGIGDVCDTDVDGDQVIDQVDQCLNTALGEVVNEVGCAINDLCPCDNGWRNHGAYVRCVAHASEDFLEAGLISEEEKDATVSEAAQSACGKKK